MTRTAALIGLTLLTLATGCSSWTQWKYVRDRPPGKALTRLLVRTSPPGGEISINGDYQGKEPIEIPVRYPYVVRLYERSQTLPYPHRESREIRVYEKNVFRVEAYLMGHTRASKSVAVNGEEKVEVTLELR